METKQTASDDAGFSSFMHIISNSVYGCGDIVKNQRPCDTPEDLEATRRINEHMENAERDFVSKAAMSEEAVRNFRFTD